MSIKTLNALKKRLFEELKSTPDLDHVDAQRLLDRDHFLSHFLTENNGDIERTVVAVLKCFAYRVRKGFNCFTEEDVAIEVLETKKTLIGRDVHGVRYVYDMGKFHRKAFSKANEKYMLKLICLVNDKLFNEPKVNMFLDVSEGSYASLDMRLNWKLVELADTCFPGLFKNVYIIGLPTFLHSTINMVLRVLPAKTVRKCSFISPKEAKKLMGPEKATFPQELTKCTTIDKVIEKFAIDSSEADQWKSHFAWVKESVAAAQQLVPS